jgi:hypothetical protein
MDAQLVDPERPEDETERPERLKPISLHPLTTEEALAALLRVPPTNEKRDSAEE